MRRAVRAIVIKDGQLLVMHRNKFGTEYDTLPGGSVEMNESIEQALVRELLEETCISIKDHRLVFVEHAGQPYGDQYVFLCKYESGEPRLDDNAEEAHINKLGSNLYTPAWLPLEKLPASPFVSEKLKAQVLQGIQSGWPETALEF